MLEGAISTFTDDARTTSPDEFASSARNVILFQLRRMGLKYVPEIRAYFVVVRSHMPRVPMYYSSAQRAGSSTIARSTV